MAFQGFIHVHPGFCIDGRTLLVLGVRDLDSGRLVRTDVRALHDPSAADVYEAFWTSHGDAPVDRVDVPADLAASAPAAFPFPVAARAAPAKATVAVTP